MRVPLLLAAILLPGCTGGFERAYNAIPDCPEAGIAHFELATSEWNDANVSAAFRAKDWTNIQIRYVGVGGFASPDTKRYMTADCPAANQEALE